MAAALLAHSDLLATRSCGWLVSSHEFWPHDAKRCLFFAIIYSRPIAGTASSNRQ